MPVPIGAIDHPGGVLTLRRLDRGDLAGLADVVPPRPCEPEAA